MLPKEAIEEFKDIYKKEFKEELSDADALTKANRLLDLYGAIFESLVTTSKQRITKHE